MPRVMATNSLGIMMIVMLPQKIDRSFPDHIDFRVEKHADSIPAGKRNNASARLEKWRKRQFWRTLRRTGATNERRPRADPPQLADYVQSRWLVLSNAEAGAEAGRQGEIFGARGGAEERGLGERGVR